MPLNVPTGATITNLAPASSPRLFWTATTQPVFNGPRNIGQTLQGSIADCFVLASLVSILSKPHGASVLEGMFKDEGATVVVRLYGSGPSDVLYYRVPKGRILSEGAIATRQRRPVSNRVWLEPCMARNSPRSGLHQVFMIAPAALSRIFRR